MRKRLKQPSKRRLWLLHQQVVGRSAWADHHLQRVTAFFAVAGRFTRNIEADRNVKVFEVELHVGHGDARIGRAFRRGGILPCSAQMMVASYVPS